MVGGTTSPPQSDSRESSRALVLNLSGETSGAQAPPRKTMSLTTPSLLSRGTQLSRSHRLSGQVRATLLFAGHFQTGFSALQGVLGAGIVLVGAAALEAFFRALLGFLRALGVDFCWVLASFGENGDFVRKHFSKSPSYGEGMLLPTALVSDFTDCQFGNPLSDAGEGAH